MPAGNTKLAEVLGALQGSFHAVVPFDHRKERLVAMDFTQGNALLQHIDVSQTAVFSGYIDRQLQAARAKFGIGGYGELRTLYSMSRLFDENSGGLPATTGEPRRFHLGVDIWGAQGTPVYVPLAGVVHGFAFNDHFGDYGATIILRHQINQIAFFTLYGHLSLADIGPLHEGQEVAQGSVFAHFGSPEENGHWPPHLHFQLVHQLGDQKGDYPGVCKYSEKEIYLDNCPDPDLILDLARHVPPGDAQ